MASGTMMAAVKKTKAKPAPAKAPAIPKSETTPKSATPKSETSKTEAVATDKATPGGEPAKASASG